MIPLEELSEEAFDVLEQTDILFDIYPNANDYHKLRKAYLDKREQERKERGDVNWIPYNDNDKRR